MIRIENTEVHGFEAAIRGARNPYDSWDKSDSWHGCRSGDYGHTDSYDCENRCKGDCGFCLGQNDRKLLLKLAKAGDDHGKALRMINVTCDITAPRYWTAEFDTYKVGTVRNSCSTMHTIHKKPFTAKDFSFDKTVSGAAAFINHIIAELNGYRNMYVSTGDKAYWYTLIQLLPASYNQRFTWQANYQVLRHMYHARKNHKLSEWHDFCRWVESLPYSELITEV